MVMFILGFFSINLIMRTIIGTGQEVTVPNIVGVHFDVARKKGMELNLYVQQVDFQHSEEILKGRIISQFPQPGSKTKMNRTIEVIVSQGQELVRVPYLENITESDARLRLQNVGLRIGDKIYRYSSDVLKDRIVYTQPLADDMVPRGSEINIVISLGELPDATTDSIDRYRGLLD